jgi:hypothetical protein
MPKVIYLTVKVIVEDGADAQEVSTECAYSFEHPAILETEIVGVKEREGQ